MKHRLAPVYGGAITRAVGRTLLYVGRLTCPLLLAGGAASLAHAQVEVSITAIDDTAGESPTDSGRFLVRAEDPSKTIKLKYIVGGSATPGEDYKRLSGKLDLKSKEPEVFIDVDVEGDDGRFEGDETVVVTLLEDDNGKDDDDDDDDDAIRITQASATVTIRDSVHTVTIAGISNASEGATAPGELRVSLDAINESGAPLSVTYSVGGTASPGSDYTALPNIAVIGDGSRTASIAITPLNDTLQEGSETVQVTLTGTGHSRVSVGSPGSATVSIADDDSGGGDDDGGGDDGGGGGGGGNDGGDDGSGGGGGGSGGGATADGDGDGLSNDRESELGTDPQSADTDEDGVNDGEEVTAGTDPLDAASFADADGDLVPDAVELATDSDAWDPGSYRDSDGGGTADYTETVTYANLGIASTDAADPADDRRDLDGDGLPDRLEVAISSDPGDPGSPTPNGGADSNGNGITDAVEKHLATVGIVAVSATSDVDRDGYPDVVEVALGMNPLRSSESDDDGDGVPNVVEALAGTDIDAATDTDGDGVPDAREFALESDFLDANVPVSGGNLDDDQDGISNAIEHVLEALGVVDNVAPGTDSDGDGIPDAEEIRTGGDPAHDEQPVPWIEVRQAGIGSVRGVMADANPAFATAVVAGHQSGSLLYDWRESDNAVLAVALSDHTSRTLEFLPRTLPPGTYRLAVRVERTLGDYSSAPSVVEFPLVVSADAQRGDIADADSDGIPDGVDDVDGRRGFANELPAQSGRWLQAESGARLQLGNAARGSLAASARVTEQDIANAGGDDGGTVGNSEDVYDYLGGIYDFEVTALPEVGAVVQVVIPQASPIGEFPEYRKYRPGGGWSGFVENERNRIESAAGSSAGCPAAGDDSYERGLTAGHHCVQLSIEDGGPNDADAALGPNGIVKDPGGVATPEGEVVAGSGSGRIELWSVLALLLLVALLRGLPPRRRPVRVVRRRHRTPRRD